MGRQRRKLLGQNFLTCRDVAMIEAEIARGRDVIEIGPGRGILTHELCRCARRVLAVEIDRGLYDGYGEREGNLQLLNADFFAGDIETSSYDMLVSNIPYSMSSRTLAWLFAHRIEAVLCVQKEFAEHMMARNGGDRYSRLSVLTSLSFEVRKVVRVPAGCFRPRPKVDSMVVHMLPKRSDISTDDSRTITLLMEHKKKTLKSAVVDAREGLGLTKEGAREAARGLDGVDERVFKIAPERLLSIARALNGQRVTGSCKPGQ